MFRKKTLTLLDPAAEAADLATYALTMFDHAVASLNDSTDLLLQVEAEALAAADAAQVRAEAAADARLKNERVVGRIEALVA